MIHLKTIIILILIIKVKMYKIPFLFFSANNKEVLVLYDVRMNISLYGVNKNI